MSDALFKTLRNLNDLARMPRLGDAVKFSNEALRLMIEGKEVSVHSLKIKAEDIQEGRAVLAFAFCDKDDNPIVNVGRFELVGEGSTLTIVNIANALNFTVS